MNGKTRFGARLACRLRQCRSYTWNALNQLTSAGGVTYTYDGDGRRVKKSNGTLYWYGPGESVLAETDLSGNPIRESVYFNGARVARRDSAGSAYYLFSDHLGTAQVMTNATGVSQQESTYYPFGGEQWPITNTVDNRYRLTGLERDGETGLDHTQFRKCSPIQARWLSPDPICSNCLDPQQLNRYSHVANDPINPNDPFGLEPCYVKPDGTYHFIATQLTTYRSGGGGTGTGHRGLQEDRAQARDLGTGLGPGEVQGLAGVLPLIPRIATSATILPT